jgi:hypothetical protein
MHYVERKINHFLSQVKTSPYSRSQLRPDKVCFIFEPSDEDQMTVVSDYVNVSTIRLQI